MEDRSKQSPPMAICLLHAKLTLVQPRQSLTGNREVLASLLASSNAPRVPDKHLQELWRVPSKCAVLVLFPHTLPGVAER